MMMSHQFKLTLTHPLFPLIMKLVLDSIINSYSDYHQELKLIYQEKTGSELLELQKLEIMETVKPPEIDTCLSSKLHGIPMVCKYNSLPMILKLKTTTCTQLLKSMMNTTKYGTMSTSLTLTKNLLPQEDFYLLMELIGKFQTLTELSITPPVKLHHYNSSSDQVTHLNSNP